LTPTSGKFIEQRVPATWTACHPRAEAAELYSNRLTMQWLTLQWRMLRGQRIFEDARHTAIEL
jgi:hypothetical protein